jgi:hypothetical protein
MHRKAYDLLLMSQAAAKFNLRDVSRSWKASCSFRRSISSTEKRPV